MVLILEILGPLEISKNHFSPAIYRISLHHSYIGSTPLPAFEWRFGSGFPTKKLIILQGGTPPMLKMELFHPYKWPYKWVTWVYNPSSYNATYNWWRGPTVVTFASWESQTMRIILLLLRLSMANWGQLWATIPRAATAVKRMKWWDSGDSTVYEKFRI